MIQGHFIELMTILELVIIKLGNLIFLKENLLVERNVVNVYVIAVHVVLTLVTIKGSVIANAKIVAKHVKNVVVVVAVVVVAIVVKI